ncbi:MAG: hypothetical protein U0S36_05885 [Candidatus Nanopelagicales bacterium]
MTTARPAAAAPQTPEALAKAAEAKARRAARKAARAAAPPPERDAAYDRYSLADLRAVRSELADEETRVSYWRRIIQARLDIVQTDLVEQDPVADLKRVFAEAPVVRRRIANLSVHPTDTVPPLPDLAEVWARHVDREDDVETERLVRDLAKAEKELSEFRRDLHRRIDAVTAELIARYREQPLLALQILPTDPLHRH